MLEQTPLAVIVAPPSLLMLPPHNADDEVMPEMEEVEIIGIAVVFGSSQALICIMNMAAIKYNATKN